MSNSSTSRVPRVVALLMDGMWTHDLANVIQVFGNGVPLEGRAPCDLAFASTGRSVSLDHGLSAATTPLCECDPAPELVCVPGFVDPCRSIQSDETAETIAWLREAFRHGAEVASLGTGAFVLGAAGLLDGLRCATHHASSAEFRRLFPVAVLDVDSVFTHDRDRGIWTSAGGASGLDLCLSLVSHLSGPVVASQVAEAMSLWNPRPLGTRSDAFGMPGTPEGERRGRDVGQVCKIVRADLSRSWTVASMARVGGVSVRTFQRHFLESMGDSPKRWLLAQRLELATMLLVQTDLPMPVVASRVGLSGADALYRLFVARLGESPSSYRKRFSSQ
ncbi:MAG: helix-turn-helix domain-containing protein [Coriobacteriaceae bacterium]|nr:helix-turn-helix domain-containing protein [Coriobacteriaceae bacterium]MCI7438383.1 helix-turn-helix domain-containing protein [Coriobacteriaceae bacterium]